MSYSRNEWTDQDAALCKAQSALFGLAGASRETASGYFVRSYMASPYAKMMDDGTFLSASLTVEDVYAEIKKKLRKPASTNGRYGEAAMRWMGYLYRYWALTKQMTSRQIYALASSEKMLAFFPAYHSADPEKALAMILASHPGERRTEEPYEKFYRLYERELK